MPAKVISLLGSTVDGFSIIQDMEDELVLSITFICDDEKKRTIRFTVDKADLHNPGRQYDSEKEEWKDIP